MRKIFVLLSLLLLISLSLSNYAQDYDYRYEESPAITWNGLSLFDSRAMAMGGISLAASPHSKQLANPALFSDDKNVNFGISYNYIRFVSFQYWGINEGVKKYDSPFSESKMNISSVVFISQSWGWSFSGGWHRSALRDFPDFSFRNEYDFEQYDLYNGTFQGFDDNYFISFGISLSKIINLGLKIEYIKGRRDVLIENISSLYYFLDGSWQLKDKITEYSEKHNSSVIRPELGLVLKLSSKLMLGFKMSYPFSGEVEREIERNFRNSDGINFNDLYKSSDEYYEVPRFSMGALHNKENVKILKLNGKLILGMELEYLKWSDYRHIFFGEELNRVVKDSVKLSAGAEYSIRNGKKELFFRLGFVLDKQPVKVPETYLKVLTGGIGIRFGKLNGDIGIAYYMGSPGGIYQGHFILGASAGIRL